MIFHGTILLKEKAFPMILPSKRHHAISVLELLLPVSFSPPIVISSLEWNQGNKERKEKRKRRFKSCRGR